MLDPTIRTHPEVDWTGRCSRAVTASCYPWLAGALPRRRGIFRSCPSSWRPPSVIGSTWPWPESAAGASRSTRGASNICGSHVPKSDCLSLTTAQLQWRATGTSDQHLLVASSQAYTKPSTMRPSHSSRSTAAHRDPAGRTRGDVPRPRRALAATITAHRPLISEWMVFQIPYVHPCCR